MVFIGVYDVFRGDINTMKISMRFILKGIYGWEWEVFLCFRGF